MSLPLIVAELLKEFNVMVLAPSITPDRIVGGCCSEVVAVVAKGVLDLSQRLLKNDRLRSLSSGAALS